MPTILRTVWLNDAAYPSDSMNFIKMSVLKRTATSPARVQRVAGGRLRVIRRAGEPREWALTLPLLTRVQVDWLESHLGATVCARDDRGHKFFAVYLAVPVDERKFEKRGDVTLTLAEVSFSESV